ncbi:MAG: chromosomal replication initiator protein DnaA [Phycisphaerales bacterium]|nr:chromosomal replication initiator protein DnaA [Phycisphaerales bacterium]
MDLVRALSDSIARRIGANRFRTWFGGGAQFEFEDGRVRVLAPNDFVGEWIANNYIDEIVEAAGEVAGKRVRVEIHVRPADSPPANLRDVERSQSISATPNIAPSIPTPMSKPPLLRGRLDSFVVGPCNRIAWLAAQQVAERPGNGFNLLVVHGPCGVGKTHLLQGVCNALADSHSGLSCRYVSGEEFTNEYIAALRAGRLDVFRMRFRHVDLLAIDDLHFIADKKATQSEFLHTFNSIDGAGKTVVLTSDKHPNDLGACEPLANRLISGMVAEINAPCAETRRGIVEQLAAQTGLLCPAEVTGYIADRFVQNVRELEGAWRRLVAYASLTRAPLSMRLAAEALGTVRRAPRQTAEDIERIVCERLGVTREQVHSASRDRAIVGARAMVMYMLRRHTQLSFPEIGTTLGGKNHSTVLMAVKRVKQAAEAGDVIRVRWNGVLDTHPAAEIIAALDDELAPSR